MLLKINVAINGAELVDIEHWTAVAAEARPKGVAGTDVTFAGITRAVLRYALLFWDEQVREHGVRKTCYRLYAMRVRTVRSPGTKRTLLSLSDELHDELSAQAATNTEGWDWKTFSCLLFFAGLQRLHEEDPGEVTEFLRRHFIEEAAAGLHRGRPKRAAAEPV